MKNIFVILSAIFSLFIFGCKTTDSTSKTNAKGTTPSQICGEWKIQSLTGFKNADQTDATLSIIAKDEDEYSLNGFSGVNSFFATLSDTPKAFPIGNNLASTKMMGAPEDMAFEDELIKIIATSGSWKIENRKLVITNGKASAVFVK
ncbi:META domain-containing protein [Treponema sp.]|uniref:META domain-containing protein n=1 Tax=Treponema sp. TaxID=166 RepID=UPI00298DD95B|nr:META domain-containing protein [Treponema sp.]MCQ2240126.1 META domain-containing protein [Treponema sp.]